MGYNFVADTIDLSSFV